MRSVDRKCICGFQLHFYSNLGPFIIFCWFSYKCVKFVTFSWENVLQDERD